MTPRQPVNIISRVFFRVFSACARHQPEASARRPRKSSLTLRVSVADLRAVIAPGKLPGSGHDSVDHRNCQPAGECVLLAGVVATEERNGTHARFDAVAEARLLFRPPAEIAKRSQHAVPGETPETNNHPHALKDLQFFNQVRKAIVSLLGAGPIGGGSAAHAGRHITIP